MDDRFASAKAESGRSLHVTFLTLCGRALPLTRIQFFMAVLAQLVSGRLHGGSGFIDTMAGRAFLRRFPCSRLMVAFRAVIFQPFGLSSTAYICIAVVAAFVGLFGYNQYRANRQTNP